MLASRCGSGIRQTGRNFPASPEASRAPSTMPKSMTEVMSPNGPAASAFCMAGVSNPDQLPTGTPTLCRTEPPHSAKAEVMPQGRPARYRVVKLSRASAKAPANSGQGPRSQELFPLSAMLSTEP